MAEEYLYEDPATMSWDLDSTPPPPAEDVKVPDGQGGASVSISVPDALEREEWHVDTSAPSSPLDSDSFASCKLSHIEGEGEAQGPSGGADEEALAETTEEEEEEEVTFEKETASAEVAAAAEAKAAEVVKEANVALAAETAMAEHAKVQAITKAEAAEAEAAKSEAALPGLRFQPESNRYVHPGQLVPDQMPQQVVNEAVVLVAAEAAATEDEAAPPTEPSDFELVARAPAEAVPPFDVLPAGADSMLGRPRSAQPPVAAPTHGVITHLPHTRVPGIPPAPSREELASKSARLMELRAQFRSFGPMGQALQELVARESAAHGRERKHLPASSRGPMSEGD
eukprot:gene7199-5299_t